MNSTLNYYVFIDTGATLYSDAVQVVLRCLFDLTHLPVSRNEGSLVHLSPEI